MGAYPIWLWLGILVFDLVCVLIPILAVRPSSQLAPKDFAIRFGYLFAMLYALAFLAETVHSLFDLQPTFASNPVLLQKIIPPSDAGFSMQLALLNVTPNEITINLSLGGLLRTAITIAMFSAVVWWSASRTQDAGWSKWWCLLWAVPLVNFVFLFVLFLRPSASVLEARFAESHHRPASEKYPN